MEEETTSLLCGTIKLNVLFGNAKENKWYLTKYSLSEQSVDFRDWHIFKTGNVMQIGSLLAGMCGD